MVNQRGRYTVACVMDAADYERLKLVMEHMDRRTMSDCVRALINDAAKKILSDASAIANNNPARSAAANQ